MTNGTAIELSVVVPVHRNEATLALLEERLRAVLENEMRYEIVFVNDACPAGSAAVLDSLASTRPHVRAVHLARNRGQHGAALIGLSLARGSWCVVMDADLQDPPEALPRLLAARDASVAAVFAGRRGRYESALRLLTSRVFKTCLHLACGVPRDAGIFVLIRRDLVERMLAMRTATPFIVAMVGCAGLPQRSVPVERVPRAVGESSYRGWDRMRSAARAFRCVIECRWRPTAQPYLAGEAVEDLGSSTLTSS